MERVNKQAQQQLNQARDIATFSTSSTNSAPVHLTRVGAARIGTFCGRMRQSSTLSGPTMSMAPTTGP